MSHSCSTLLSRRWNLQLDRFVQNLKDIQLKIIFNSKTSCKSSQLRSWNKRMFNFLLSDKWPEWLNRLSKLLQVNFLPVSRQIDESCQLCNRRRLLESSGHIICQMLFADSARVEVESVWTEIKKRPRGGSVSCLCVGGRREAVRPAALWTSL